MSELEKVLAEVLEKIVPPPEEEERVAEEVGRALDALGKALEELSIEAVAEVEGSFAKGTWLSGDVDVDVFLLFDPSVGVEEMRGKSLSAAKRAAEKLGVGWTERYASHPYLTLKLSSCDMDVVPAYRVSDPSRIKSPVDRTPFHTQYVKRRLGERPELKNEVRLLKRFAKGVGIYGAEIRVEGFSGYLLELLAIHCGSFLGVLRAAASWRPYGVVIDIEKHYSDRRQVLERFEDPLVVVDPVDPRRNVASPVSLENLSKFVAAARAFLREPSTRFFFPVAPKPRRLEEVLRGRAVAAVKLQVPPMPEDVLWGQARRALKALSSGLERLSFKILGSSAWAEGSELVLLFELETLELPPLEKHRGPPVYSKHDERFVSQYLKGECIAGPYVDGDKWVVIRPRRLRKTSEALAKLLRTYNVGEHITKCAREGFVICTGEEVLGISASESFRRHLYEWLIRRPPWLWNDDAEAWEKQSEGSA